MGYRRHVQFGLALAAAAILSGCGGFGSGGSGGSGLFTAGKGRSAQTPAERPETSAENIRQSSFLDLFTNKDDPNTTVEVNKYLWNASLDVLNFLPIEAADPFSGVIVTGYGTPPGGGRAYRAVIYVQDPALDARSLKVAIHTRGGPASPETVRAVEDAILTRARQLRIRDGKL